MGSFQGHKLMLLLMRTSLSVFTITWESHSSFLGKFNYPAMFLSFFLFFFSWCFHGSAWLLRKCRKMEEKKELLLLLFCLGCFISLFLILCMKLLNHMPFSFLAFPCQPSRLPLLISFCFGFKFSYQICG